MGKQIRIDARITESERQELEALAHLDGLNKSDYLRELIRKEADRRGVSVDPAQPMTNIVKVAAQLEQLVKVVENVK